MKALGILVSKQPIKFELDPILGMDLNKILTSVTLTPAKIISKQSEIGDISGSDWTVLELVDADLISEDCSGSRKQLKKMFVPRYVVRKGVFKVLK